VSDAIPQGDPQAVQIDVDLVNEMVAERLRYKVAREFQQADLIQKALAAIGVVVYDNERMWEALPGDVGKSHELRSQFGQLGHDYRRTDDGLTYQVDIDKVNDLISRRLSAKMDNNFLGADQLRHELARVGVEVDDPSRELLVPPPLTQLRRWSNHQPSQRPLLPQQRRAGSQLLPMTRHRARRDLEGRADLVPVQQHDVR
jgi:hypothetical protein